MNIKQDSYNEKMPPLPYRVPKKINGQSFFDLFFETGI